MRNQILQRYEHGLLPKEDHFHDSLCVLYQPIFIILVSFSMGIVAPYKLHRKENTKAKHSEDEKERFIIKLSSFCHKPVDYITCRHNLIRLPCWPYCQHIYYFLSNYE